MTIETTWRIAQLDRQTDTGGVIATHWDASSVEGDCVVTVHGYVSFMPDPNAPDFIAYDQLTETDVLTWVWGNVNKEEIEADLVVQIEAQKRPITRIGLPWA